MSQIPSLQQNSGLPAHAISTAFRRALQCASDFVGATAPNPPVGCVLLDAKGNQLAAASHEQAGMFHAESAAIELCRQQGTFERIHSVIVTLEPCNHTGRTPACTEAILGTPAQAIWIGTKDPNPDVCGKGAEKLANHGLKVSFIEQLNVPNATHMAKSATKLIAPFAKRARTGLPFVTIKQAINSAGSMIPGANRKTFTSARSLKFAHQLRKRADAILTGSGTILADAPEFTVRHIQDFVSKRRHLVIMDRRGRVCDAYQQSAVNLGFRVIIATSLEDALLQLADEGVLEVLVEAGPTLLDSVLATKFWDEHIIITQAANSTQEDNISIRYTADMKMKNTGEEQHVFRNY